MTTLAPIADTEPTQHPFNYESLASEDATAVRDAARIVQDAVRKQLASVVECGMALTKAKGLLRHGEFGRWIAAEFSMSMRTAENFMRAADTFGEKYETVAYLPLKTLYQLQAPTIPSEIREQVMGAAETGSPLPLDRIANMLAEAKSARKLAKGKTGRSLNENDRQHAHASREAEANAKRADESEEQERKVQAATDHAYSFLIRALGTNLRYFRKLLQGADEHALARRLCEDVRIAAAETQT